MKLRFRGLVSDKDRHGNIRYYYRAKGRPKVRLREPFGSDAFREELRCAELGLPYRKVEAPSPAKPLGALEGTLKWLCLEYLRRGCATFSESTVTAKRYAFERICLTPVRDKPDVTYGQMPFRLFNQQDGEYLRDLRLETPEGANYWVKQISAMFGWAMTVRDGSKPLATHNPADGVQKLRIISDGWHTWTPGEMTIYRERHPLGSMADLVFRLCLFTGLRISDVAKLGRQHLYANQREDGSTEYRIRLKPTKTARSSGVIVDIAVLPPLLEAIELVPKTQLAFVQSSLGKPYSGKVLGVMMRDWCDEAKLPQCSAHGLRKALATDAAENGATGHQLMAMFGWTTTKQAEIYTRAAERKKLASEGAKHLRLS